MKKIATAAIAANLFSMAACNNTAPRETGPGSSTFRTVYLGDVSGNFVHCYKITIDSTEYIVVGNGGAVAIIRHSK